MPSSTPKLALAVAILYTRPCGVATVKFDRVTASPERFSRSNTSRRLFAAGIAAPSSSPSAVAITAPQAIGAMNR